MKKMPKLNVTPRFAAAFIAGIALAASAQARDLTVVSWGGAYQDAQK
jgi:putative spermidine/putrescine transport system substrate-binding protein